MVNPKDLEIFHSFISADRQEQATKDAPGDIFLRAGRYFLGAPYAAKTLDASGPEGLIINLRAFDCFTLVENCCALAIMRHTGKDRFADYAAILQSLRYRDGVIAGYPSRLHYFSDWLQNNERGGLIRDITQALGGMSFREKLNFMTTHSELYPPLQDPAACRQMTAIERLLSETPRHLLPKGEITRWEEGIEEGDILSITTDQEGLDVCHVGIAVWLGEQLHLLHASQQAGQVVISPETLVDYLHQTPLRTGVMAARLAFTSLNSE
ncbi:MAG: DUF1460 domain-containing protein [Deltaproteobacteria bacterium]|nr:DUF1460 domain-containing protein [Deltaproteobacteria bacterium]